MKLVSLEAMDDDESGGYSSESEISTMGYEESRLD